jgi:RNA polymerase sigma-70 factor (sigma-E family)
MVPEDVTTTIAKAGPPVTVRTANSMSEEAFNAFVAARSTALLRTAFLLTRDRGLAEDLLQTALAKAWFAWGRIDGQPEAYVRRIVVNTYATWWRRKWHCEEATGELPESREPHASSHVEDRADLWDALGRLPRRQRAVVVLRFYEDLTEAQTADLLQCSVGTVKSQTSKALAKLRLDPGLSQTSTDDAPKGANR